MLADLPKPSSRPSRRAVRRPGPEARAARRAASIATAGLAALLLGVAPATGVLLATGDGTGNTTPPADDPGFALVGLVNGLSAVYVGNGWMLTAYHAGQSDVQLGGATYPMVPGSRVQLTGPNGQPSDLALLKIAGDPGLPAPTISATTPPVGTEVVLIGHGKDRGTPVSWRGTDGWNWGIPFTIRWGTNAVAQTQVLQSETLIFVTNFDDPGTGSATLHEAQATLGDSGGAVFRKVGAQWELAGTMVFSFGFANQPDKTSLLGNATGAADLAFYRAQILAVITTPACSDGLDDDLDGLTDHPADPGCDDPGDTSERSSALRCDDGLDNDGDGATDHPADPQCDSPLAPWEAPPVPASAPWSIGALVAGLGGLGARLARRTPRAAAAGGQSSSRTR